MTATKRAFLNKRVAVKRVGREVTIRFESGEEFARFFSRVWTQDQFESWLQALGYKTYRDLWGGPPLAWEDGQVGIPANRLYAALAEGGKWSLEFATPEAAREAYPMLVGAARNVMKAVTEHMKQVLSNKDETVLEFSIPIESDRKDSKTLEFTIPDSEAS